MHVEFARFVGVLIGLLHAVTPPAAAESTRREQKLRFGVATAFEGDACIAIEGPELAAPTVVTVIDTELLPRVFTFVVDASVQNCPLLKSQGSIGTQYRAHLADGELPSDRLLGIAVVGKFPGHGGRRDFTLDLGPAVPKGRVSSCTSSEGLWLNLWSAVPRKSTLLWQVYWYLGYDVEPTCRRADYQRSESYPRRTSPQQRRRAPTCDPWESPGSLPGYNPAVNNALSTLLDTYENQLAGLTGRQFFVEAFKADLDKVTRGADFRIRNGVLWRMFLDTRDALVVCLASWTRGVYQPGGLIDRLQADHANDLPLKRLSSPHDDVPFWREDREREHADALSRLFPGMSEEYPDDSQFSQLRQTFSARMTPVVDDASNRVRPFDRDPQAESATLLNFSELRDAISYAERFLNDLNTVGCQHKLDYREMNTPNAEDVVPDIVDAILLGTPDQIERLRGGLDRVAFYDELHHRQSADPARYFNDKLFSSSITVKGDGGREQSEGRHVGFFPALPLEKNLELGAWVVGTPPASTPWASSRFRELSESLVRSFGKVGFSGGAMLWHRDRGFDGLLPSNEEIQAIRAAVAFAVLDANDRVPEINRGHYLATADNADLFLQPIDEDGGITHSREGALKRIMVGNMKIGGEPPPLAESVEKISRPVRVSAKLAGAIYAAVRSGTGDGPSIAIAADWHRGALVNSPAMSTEHRLVSIKIGFEALFNTDKSRKCARDLRALFETTTKGHRKLGWPWIGLLWSPTEKTKLQRTYTTLDGKIKPDVRSELEDWFMALADARNDIIHKGKLKTGLYPAPQERPRSRYAGKLFWRGERVLREAIKAKLGVDVLLCGPLERDARIKAALQASQAAGPTPAPPQMDPEEVALWARIKSEPQPPNRDLPALLAALACSAANEIVLSKAHGFPSASPQANLESSIRLMDKWHADVGDVDQDTGRGILVSGAECQTLRAAGAEDELAGHWWPCP